MHTISIDQCDIGTLKKLREQIDKLKNNQMEYLLNCNGKQFRCKIHGIECEGVISVEKNMVFLCQNKMSGRSCFDKKGYKYSWCAQGTDGIINSNLSDFHLIDQDPETYKDWQIGDKIKNIEYKINAEVIFRYGKLVVYKFGNCKCSNNYTCDELFDLGWRLISEQPEMVELTLEQVAEKFGIETKMLRIKEK